MLPFMPASLAEYQDLEPEEVGIRLVKFHLGGRETANAKKIEDLWRNLGDHYGGPARLDEAVGVLLHSPSQVAQP